MMSVTVNTYYAEIVTRWQPDSRGRLEVAALALFGERGFDDTTVAEIAERAGLTERTFFRHFTDKRDVLFGGASALQDLFVTEVANAPATASPLDAAVSALEAAGALLEERRDYARQRHAIIAASAELRERELIKLATLSGAIAAALRARGVLEPSASLTGEVAITVFKVGFARWVAPSEDRTLSQLMRSSLDDLRAVTVDDPTPSFRSAGGR
jgi:AcrR family transcriptional regulator